MSKQAQIFQQSSGTMQVCVLFLPWVCSVIDHRRHQNVVKASVPHSPANRVPLLCFYNNHLDVICDLFLNRRRATWNLFVFKVEYTILEPDKPDTFGEIPFENLEIYPMCYCLSFLDTQDAKLSMVDTLLIHVYCSNTVQLRDKRPTHTQNTRTFFLR